MPRTGPPASANARTGAHHRRRTARWRRSAGSRRRRSRPGRITASTPCEVRVAVPDADRVAAHERHGPQRVAVVEGAREGRRRRPGAVTASPASATSSVRQDPRGVLDHRVRQEAARPSPRPAPRPRPRSSASTVELDRACRPGRSVTFVQPSVGSAPSTALPCGSSRPGFSVTTHLEPERRSRRRHPHPLQVGVERLAGDPLVRLAVAGGGLFDDLGGQLGRRRLVVPAARVEPVAHVLLVERRLRPARARTGPPARTATSPASAPRRSG